MNALSAKPHRSFNSSLDEMASSCNALRVDVMVNVAVRDKRSSTPLPAQIERRFCCSINSYMNCNINRETTYTDNLHVPRECRA